MNDATTTLTCAEIGAEVSEQMDIIPEQVRVLQHHRIKYACPCCDQSLKIAPTPARIIPRGLLTEQAQAWVITGKYQFGMPLYRTAALLRRFGGDIAGNTWPPASCASARPCSRSSTCCETTCWTRT
jgi:transposase